jgi:hypothetical protein
MDALPRRGGNRLYEPTWNMEGGSDMNKQSRIMLALSWVLIAILAIMLYNSNRRSGADMNSIQQSITNNAENTSSNSRRLDKMDVEDIAKSGRDRNVASGN